MLKQLREIPKDFKLVKNKLGVIGSLVFLFFRILKLLPPQVFVEERVTHQLRISTLEDSEKDVATKHRANRTELIIFIFFLYYIFAWWLLRFVHQYDYLKCMLIVLLLFRLIDIVQVNVNITLFDSLRLENAKLNLGKGEDHHMSIYRSIIFISYNFLEVGIIFGFLYSLVGWGALVVDDCSLLKFEDRLYFSFVNQLTIGFGDIKPVGFFRFISIVQSLIGYFFSIVIIGRIVAGLPSVVSAKDPTG